jgi:hypothetical protein
MFVDDVAGDAVTQILVAIEPGGIDRDFCFE